VKKTADGVVLSEFIVQHYRLTRFYDENRSATIA